MNSLRSTLPALENKYYFNYGGQGPLPNPSLNAITASWRTLQNLGPFTNNVWPYIANEIKATKSQISKICGIPNRRIALTENVTTGCVLPIWGLPFSTGDRLLISNCEHPGVVSACKELARRAELEIDILDVQTFDAGINKRDQTNKLITKRLKDALNPKTRLVVLSHLLWNTGEIMPIELIADILKDHQSQPFLLVDGAQSFGQIPINEAASKVDIYAFTGHKWAFGPEGLGGVILSERVLQKATPTLIGWKSLVSESSIYTNNAEPFHTDARKFEIATSCTPLLAGLRSSLSLLEQEGTESERITKIQSLSRQLWIELNSINGVNPILQSPPPAGLVSFTMNSKMSPNKIVKHLGEQSIWIRALEDPIWLRACVHVTSRETEISLLANSLKDISK